MNGFHTFMLAGALLAVSAPVSALAQMPPNGGPPPQLEQVRNNTKTAAYNDLTVDHRAKVQAIVARVKDGSLSMRDAAGQIDALLSPGETKAVLGEGSKMHDAMRQAFARNGPPAGGPPPGGWGGHREGNHKPGAGRLLLMLSAPPHMMRPDGDEPQRQ